jgi:hypothetical protein
MDVADVFEHRWGSAPVAIALEVDARGSPVSVWDHLVRMERWRSWYRGIDSAHVRRRGAEGEIGPSADGVGSSLLAVGDRLDWRVDGIRIRSRITEVVPTARLAWTLQTLGAHGALRWTLVPTPEDGCRVRLEEWWAGMPVRLLRGTLRRTLQISRIAWLEGLLTQVDPSPPEILE